MGLIDQRVVALTITTITRNHHVSIDIATTDTTIEIITIDMTVQRPVAPDQGLRLVLAAVPMVVVAVLALPLPAILWCKGTLFSPKRGIVHRTMKQSSDMRCSVCQP